MKIIKERKRIEAVELFPTLNDFINFIENENDKINIHSNMIKNKIRELYTC